MEPFTLALLEAASNATVGHLHKLFSEIGERAYIELAEKFNATFNGHISSIHSKCSKIKNIIYRDVAVDFMSQYVNVMFESDNKNYVDVEVISKILEGERVLISGTAGAGKTMFIRWCTLELINNIRERGRIPIYIEMRDLNEDDITVDFVTLLCNMTSSSQERVQVDVFKKGLETGHIVVFLDAIDEIKPKIRDKMLRKIRKFLHDYKNCGVLVTTRPDPTLENLPDFFVFHSKPLRKDQIISILEKINFDPTVKSNLIGKLNGALYEQLKGFLTTPLLVTILLLTYGHTADIPTKVTTFYQQAFEVLYQRHDAAKGGYKRTHYCELSIDQFRAIFSAFCFQTYIDSKYEFSSDELVSSMRDAIEYTGIEAKPEDMVNDAMETVCLIGRDGLRYVFSHRSFQEYFTAIFVTEYRGDEIFQLVDGVFDITRNPGRSVISMLQELSPDLIEFKWAVRVLEQLVVEFNKYDLNSIEGFTSVFNMLYSEAVISSLSRDIIMYMPTKTALYLNEFDMLNEYELGFLETLNRSKLWSNSKLLIASIKDGEVKTRTTTRLAELHKLEKAHRKISRFELFNSARFRVTKDDMDWLFHTNLRNYLGQLVVKIDAYKGELMRRKDSKNKAVTNISLKLSKIKKRI